MDIEFFRGWDSAGEVHVGARLMRSISTLPVFLLLSSEAALIPDGHEDAGYEIARYDLAAIRYAFAGDIADLLANKCKLAACEGSKGDRASDARVLLKLIGYLLDNRYTHFELS